MIRVEAVWLCTEPMDMRAGTDTTMARVVQVFGAVRPHHAYVFANKPSTRLKVLVHDGIGIWPLCKSCHNGHEQPVAKGGSAQRRPPTRRSPKPG